MKFGSKAVDRSRIQIGGRTGRQEPGRFGHGARHDQDRRGTSTLNSADQFTYRGVPSVSSVSPKEGPETGGTIVTIDGANLEAATHVTFGGVAAKIVTDTAGAIEAESPANHTPAPVDIVVTTEGGSSTTSTADQFTYRGVPTVSAVVAERRAGSGRHRGQDHRDELHKRERSEVRLEGLDRSRIQVGGRT